MGMETPLSRVLFPLKTSAAAAPSRAKISMSTGAENPSSHPQWVLFDAHAFTGSPSHMKATAARETTANHQTIEVSFCPSYPPLPSTLLVCYPNLENPNTGFTILPLSSVQWKTSSSSVSPHPSGLRDPKITCRRSTIGTTSSTGPTLKVRRLGHGQRADSSSL